MSARPRMRNCTPGLRSAGSSAGRAIPRKLQRTAEGGFTLVELSIAVLLLTIGVLGVMQVFAVADRHTAYAREETVAASLAQEIREKILSESFADIYSIFDGIDTDVPGTVPTPAQDWAGHVTTRLGAEGRGTVEVQTPAQDPTLSNGMVSVTIRIYWNERGRQVELPLQFAVAKTSP